MCIRGSCPTKRYSVGVDDDFSLICAASGLQCWSEIIETNAKNGVVFDATSNEQPI